MNNIFNAIVGVQKAGTTTIYELLKESPDIYAPTYLKDYHIFFNPILNKEKIDDYKHQIKIQNLHCGVNYITNKESIREILKFNKNTKFIIILRNPIDRAISGYYHACRKGIENRSFLDAINMDINSNKEQTGRIINPDKDYVKHGLYYEQIVGNLLSQINLKNIGVFYFEEIFFNNCINIDDIINFIGIPKYNYSKDLKKNIRGEARFKILNKILFSRSKFKSKVANLVPTKCRVDVKQKLYEVNYKKNSSDSMFEDEIDFLKDYYKNDILKLSKLLKKDLNSLWLNEK